MLYDPGLSLTDSATGDVLICAGQREYALFVTRLSHAACRALNWDGGQLTTDPPRAVVLDCDTCGGEAAARDFARFVAARGRRVPIILLVRDLVEQVFPTDPSRDPILLRKPLSALSVRIACDFLFSKENGAQPLPVRPAVA